MKSAPREAKDEEALESKEEIFFAFGPKKISVSKNTNKIINSPYGHDKQLFLLQNWQKQLFEHL